MQLTLKTRKGTQGEGQKRDDASPDRRQFTCNPNSPYAPLAEEIDQFCKEHAKRRGNHSLSVALRRMFLDPASKKLQNHSLVFCDGTIAGIPYITQAIVSKGRKLDEIIDRTFELEREVSAGAISAQKTQANIAITGKSKEVKHRDASVLVVPDKNEIEDKARLTTLVRTSCDLFEMLETEGGSLARTGAVSVHELLETKGKTHLAGAIVRAVYLANKHEPLILNLINPNIRTQRIEELRVEDLRIAVWLNREFKPNKGQATLRISPEFDFSQSSMRLRYEVWLEGIRGSDMPTITEGISGPLDPAETYYAGRASFGNRANISPILPDQIRELLDLESLAIISRNGTLVVIDIGANVMFYDKNDH